MKNVYNYAMTIVAVLRILGRRAKRTLDQNKKSRYSKKKDKK